MTNRDWSKNLWSRIKSLFGGLDSRVTALEQSSGGGEDNVIEAISFNGSNVPPDASKRVSLTESDPTVPSWAKANAKPTYTASEVGAIPTTDKGASGGVATLDSSGKVPSAQLPDTSVTDGDPTLSWGTRATVGTVGGTALHVTPMALPTASQVGALEYPLKLSSVDVTQADNDVSTNAGRTFVISDKNNRPLGGLQVYAYHDGIIELSLLVSNYSSGALRAQQLSVKHSKSGAVTYTVPYTANFRAAIDANDDCGLFIDSSGYICQQLTNESR